LTCQQNGETNFSLFRTFQPRAAGVKKNKSPAHHRRRNDPVTSYVMSLVNARTGRQMGIFSCSRTLGVAVMAWGMVSFGPAPDLAAGTPLSPGHADLVRKSAEPFGVFAFRLSRGGLREKWLGVQRKLDDELIQLALCDGDRERCVSPAALRFLAIVDNAKAREGRARLGEINRAINLAIHPMSDLAQYREIAWLDFNFKLVKSMLHCN
jgi:hypothetical protein